MTIKDEFCTIHDGKGGLIAKIKMARNRLFPLYINYATSCFSASVQDSLWLWHKRFGHVNFDSLKLLSQKKMVRGLPEISSPKEICEPCVIGKKCKESFPSGQSWRASKPLELVHSDLCRPLGESPNRGYKCFSTFIDDFSRKTWVYFLKHKSDAIDAFKEFKAYVEKQSGRQIRILRTDRGTEYLVGDGFFKQCGIKHQLTAQYTPK